MIVSFFYSSGARISEVAKLRMKDLTHRADGSVLVMLHGKGGKKRPVILNRAFSKRLKAFVRGLPEGAPLFSGQRGPLTSSGLRKVIKRIVLRAELNRHISPHFFQHMHANVALNNGAKLHHVAHALGHKSIGTTSIYTRGTLLTESAPSSFLLKNKVIVQEAPMLPV